MWNQGCRAGTAPAPCGTKTDTAARNTPIVSIAALTEIHYGSGGGFMTFRRSLLLAVFALACGREVVFVDPPPAASSDTDTTTTADTTGGDTTVVQRVDLRVTVTITRADTALATRLGIPNGRLSSAQVTARRVAGQQAPQSGTTDSEGVVTLPGLLPGAWAVTAVRPLTEAERAELDSANQDVSGFGGAAQVTVSDSVRAVSIATAAGRGGTLVISEAYLPYPLVTSISGSNYLLGQYIEVHNNSFDTLYLDGKILGRAMNYVFDSDDLPCSEMARWREDPEGIWTHLFWAFPGSGRSYPLAPGASAVIATDAINHRPIYDGLLDLSNANFEFLGASDVDNPAVPNMVNLPGGWSSWPDPVGHGPWWVSEMEIFLAEPFNPDSLVRDNLPLGNPLFVRVPRDKILDVLTSGSTPEEKIGSPYCANFVDPSFDGRYAELVDGSVEHSITRKLIPGLGLLQRTKVSAVDFTLAAPSPGWVGIR
jgi:hypothetical protein